MIFDWISNFKGMPREGFLTSRTFPARIGIHSENCPTYSTQQPKSHPEAIFQDHTAASILCREPTIKYSFESWIAQLAHPRFIINSNTFGVQVFMPGKSPFYLNSLLLCLRILFLRHLLARFLPLLNIKWVARLLQTHPIILIILNSFLDSRVWKMKRLEGSTHFSTVLNGCVWRFCYALFWFSHQYTRVGLLLLLALG